MMRRALVLTFALAFSLTACGGDDASSPSRGGGDAGGEAAEQPRTLEAATSSAQEVADRISSNDRGGIWDMHSQTLKDGISREDFIKVFEACPSAGVPLQAEGVRLEGDSTAVVRLGAGDLQESRTMVYEAGQWVLEPKAWKAWIDKTPEQIIKAEKAEGSC